MKICRGPSFLEKLPMYGGAADIVDGALLTIGVTEEQDLGALILSGAAAVDAIGVKEGLYDYSVEGGDYAYLGTADNLGLVNMIMPGALLAAEYDLTDAGCAIQQMTSATAIRITSAENLASFFLYANAGTGIGQLAAVVSSDDTDYTIKSALTTTLVAADSTLTKLLMLGMNLHVLKSTRDKLISTAAAGTATLRTLYTEGKWQGSMGWERLTFVKHHNKQLYGLAPAFRSIVAPVNSWFAPID
jgi:hypothetical protein